MAVPSGTKLNNPTSLDGYVTADGFLGAPSTTDVNNFRLSTQPALFQNGLTAAGAITANGGIVNSGGTTNTVTVVAAAGATQGAATAIPATAILVNVTVTTSTEGVRLPTAATGKTVTLLPPTTKGLKVYGGAGGQVINANTTATTAFVMASAEPLAFYAVDASHWRVFSPGTFSPTTLNVSGASTLTGLVTAPGGLTTGGAQKETVTIVAAAGATQGTATAIAAGACLVNVTVTTSTEGVRLPAVSTGRVITLLTPTTKGFKVYSAAAGQVINAATTATTAFAVTTNKPATFYGVDTTHWRALRGN